MSGQPVKTVSDINKFRNEYLQTLELQEEINDMNLQANKTYLLTGQLPPSAQMLDTRTNAEKLKDVELMKHSIAKDLVGIAEPQFAYAIVDKLMKSPLNVDGGLIRFLAQRANSIAEQLKNNYNYTGIAGDENDLEIIVSFIKNMYSAQQGMFQTTKNYLQSQSSHGTKGNILSANDVDVILLDLQDFIKSLTILGISTNDNVLVNKTNTLKGLLMNGKNNLLTSDMVKLLLDELTSGAETLTDNDKTNLKAFFDLLEQLPKANTIRTLIEKAKRYVKSNNLQMAGKAIDSIIQDLSALDELKNPEFTSIRNLMNRQQRLINMYNNMPGGQPVGPPVGGPPGDRPPRGPPGGGPRGPPGDRPDDGPPGDRPNNRPPGDRPNNRPPGGGPRGPPGDRPDDGPPGDRPNNRQPRDIPLHLDPRLGLIGLQTQMPAKVFQLTDEQLQEIGNFLNRPGMTKQELRRHLSNDNAYNLGDLGVRMGRDMNGLGLKRGRPRGTGLPKPKPIKIPNFVGFGINEINAKSLDKGILKIRRNTGSNYMDMPSRHVSDNMKNIIKRIVGGGVPKYEELTKLDEDEKEYLHKIISRSNLDDKLSIPAPSKDQQEKDIHQFEIMRGQIMAGNDSLELVKKFKLLVRKLSKQGLLPKADVEDILDTLLELGY